MTDSDLSLLPSSHSKINPTQRKKMISMNKTNPGVALVTGASSGIGRATAKALQSAGFRVFGTSRRAAAERLRRPYHAGL